MGKTWKELGIKRKGRGGRGKKGKKSKYEVLIPELEESTPGGKGTVVELENLGMRVEWVDGKVYIHRNGQTEVYNSFDELRVPSRKGIRKLNVHQAKPDAIFVERNGVKYYFFPNVNVAVAMRVAYWPDSEVHPPENFFGVATPQEFAEAIRARIQSGNISPHAERAYREYKERRWKRETKRAVERAIRIVAKQSGVELPGKIPVSQALIEEMQEMGFEVRVKA